MMKQHVLTGILCVCLAGTASAQVVSYTVADINNILVAGPVGGFTAAQLIAGTNMNVATGVGMSALDGNSWTWPNDMTRQAAASAANNRWIQTGNSEVWDLGVGHSSVLVGNDFDHDRNSGNLATKYLEALEWTAWGSNNAAGYFNGATDAGAWELGRLSAVYQDGWDAGGLYDDYTGLVSFSQSYRYIHVVGANSISIGGLTSADNEIDFVAGAAVPEPASLLLLGGGLAALRFARRRNRS